MENNRNTIRTLSMLGQRGTFGVTINEIAADNDKIIALTADLGKTSGLDRFKRSFPDRFFNTGISEQNLIGTSAGLADEGFIPFATTFSNFAALRACEMIRHFLGYMKCNVKVVGFGAGYAMGMFGNTHYGLEDISAIRAIPNLAIMSPADGLETKKVIEYAASVDKPIYIRLTGVMNTPIIYREDFDFKFGKANKLKNGTDIAVIASGTVVSNALKAVDKLNDDGIRCSLYDMHTVKPVDKDVIDDCKNFSRIVVVEEHCIHGGLGSIIAEELTACGYGVPLTIIGSGEKYVPAGDYEYMLKQWDLDADGIYSVIKTIAG